MNRKISEAYEVLEIKFELVIERNLGKMCAEFPQLPWRPIIEH